MNQSTASLMIQRMSSDGSGERKFDRQTTRKRWLGVCIRFATTTRLLKLLEGHPLAVTSSSPLFRVFKEFECAMVMGPPLRDLRGSCTLPAD